MKKQHVHKKATTISLVSGKGGVGKTSITLVMGSIFSYLGKKVLLIDFDIATHGMTYFFLGRISKQNTGIIELLKNPDSEPKIVHYKPDYDVLPSTIELNAPDVSFIKNNYEKLSGTLKIVVNALSDKYDYILIDCQAGATEAVRSAIDISDKVIIVAEADPVSVWAIKNIEYEFGKILPLETFGLINKLFLEEKERYKDIVEFSRLMKFLPPLPFDMEVRRKFARRLIPGDLENPTEFLISICYAIRDLLPETEKNINGYLEQKKASKIKDLENQLDEVESKINQIQESIADIELRKKFRSEQIRRVFLMAVATFGMTIALLSLFIGQLKINIPLYWAGIIFGAILAGTAQLYIYLFTKRKKEERMSTKELSKSQAMLDTLIEKKNRLEILLIDRKKPFL